MLHALSQLLPVHKIVQNYDEIRTVLQHCRYEGLFAIRFSFHTFLEATNFTKSYFSWEILSWPKGTYCIALPIGNLSGVWSHSDFKNFRSFMVWIVLNGLVSFGGHIWPKRGRGQNIFIHCPWSLANESEFRDFPFDNTKYIIVGIVWVTFSCFFQIFSGTDVFMWRTWPCMPCTLSKLLEGTFPGTSSALVRFVLPLTGDASLYAY